MIRRFVQLLDGTRTIDELVSDLEAASPRTASPEDGGERPAVIAREDVEHQLRVDGSVSGFSSREERAPRVESVICSHVAIARRDACSNA